MVLNNLLKISRDEENVGDDGGSERDREVREDLAAMHVLDAIIETDYDLLRKDPTRAVLPIFVDYTTRKEVKAAGVELFAEASKSIGRAMLELNRLHSDPNNLDVKLFDEKRITVAYKGEKTGTSFAMIIGRFLKILSPFEMNRKELAATARITSPETLAVHLEQEGDVARCRAQVQGKVGRRAAHPGEADRCRRRARL